MAVSSWAPAALRKPQEILRLSRSSRRNRSLPPANLIPSIAAPSASVYLPSSCTVVPPSGLHLTAAPRKNAAAGATTTAVQTMLTAARLIATAGDARTLERHGSPRGRPCARLELCAHLALDPREPSAATGALDRPGSRAEKPADPGALAERWQHGAQEQRRGSCARRRSAADRAAVSGSRLVGAGASRHRRRL